MESKGRLTCHPCPPTSNPAPTAATNASLSVPARVEERVRQGGCHSNSLVSTYAPRFLDFSCLLVWARASVQTLSTAHPVRTISPVICRPSKYWLRPSTPTIAANAGSKADTIAKGSARRRFMAKSSRENGIAMVSSATTSAWPTHRSAVCKSGTGVRICPARTTRNATHKALDNTASGWDAVGIVVPTLI